MATYKDVQRDVKVQHGFVPQTCWIAHVLSENGKSMRPAANRLDPTARAKPCPPGKWHAIEESLRRLGAITR